MTTFEGPPLHEAVGIGALTFGDGLGLYLVVVLGTGAPLMIALTAWSIWFAIRRLGGDEDGPG